MFEKAQRINERWERISPKVPWGRSVRTQREELIRLLGNDELPEHIVVGTDEGFSPRTMIMVATDRRVLCIDARKEQSVPHGNILLITNEDNPFTTCVRITGTDDAVLTINSTDKAAATALVNFTKSEIRKLVRQTDDTSNETAIADISAQRTQAESFLDNPSPSTGNEQQNVEFATVLTANQGTQQEYYAPVTDSSRTPNSTAVSPAMKGCGLGCIGIIALLIFAMIIGSIGSCDDTCSRLERGVNPDGSHSLSSEDAVFFVERCYDDWARRNPV